MGEPGTIVSDHRSRIDLRRGVLRRFFDVTDAYGNITSVTERRLVSMATPHLCAIELVLVRATGRARSSCAASSTAR